MPSQTNPDAGASSDIKIKAAYNGEFMISYIPDTITYEELCQEIRVICRFPSDQVSLVEMSHTGVTVTFGSFPHFLFVSHLCIAIYSEMGG